MIAAVAAAAYSVRAIAVPGGAVVLGLEGEAHSPAVSRPPTLALGRNGTLAVVLAPVAAPSLGASVLIVRRDDSRTVLPLPPGSMSGSCDTRPVGSTSYQNAHIDAVAVARDGTPFVSMSCINDGAYISVPRSTALSNGDGWHATAADTIALGPVNRAIAAADTWAVAAYAGRGYALGFGTSLAMRGRYVAGFTAGLNSAAPDSSHPRPATALEWTDGRRRELGPGLAYDVNAGGAAVGDDEATFGASERLPMLWSGEKALPLSRSRGSAHAIADDGTIVGTVDGRAFVVAGGDATRRIRFLDDLVPSGTWRVTDAFGIAANGRILAVGSRHHGSIRVLLLDPVSR